MMALYTIVVILLLFGVTIFIHELGHFLVARWCGMVVDAFSIGFGPALWKKKIDGVTYKIGLLPFGGYVALPQMDPGGESSKDENGQIREMPKVTPGKKILVSLAGVTGNMLLAFLLAYIVYWKGKPSSPHEVNTVIGYVETNSAAYAGGVRIGDEIISINNEPVKSWDDIVLKAALSDHVELALKSKNAETKTVRLPTEKSEMGVHTLPGLGWMNYVSVASVVSGSNAEKAGLKTGDLIVQFADEQIYSREQYIQLVNDNDGRDVPLLVQRGDEKVELTVHPIFDSEVGRARIGLVLNTMYVDPSAVVHPKPLAQIKSHMSGIFRFLKALVTPKEAGKASQAVGGPLMIFYMFWLTVQNSLIVAIWFTAFLNVNLAVLNLLPIPVLDGGHIVFSLWEGITRKPVSVKVIHVIWNAFATLLIVLFLTLTYRDIVRLIIPAFSRNAPAKQAPAAVTNELPAK